MRASVGQRTFLRGRTHCHQQANVAHSRCQCRLIFDIATSTLHVGSTYTFKQAGNFTLALASRNPSLQSPQKSGSYRSRLCPTIKPDYCILSLNLMIRCRHCLPNPSSLCSELRLWVLIATACIVPVLRAQQASRDHAPEYITIPAAAPDELTPATPVDGRKFRTWTRSQGDMGSRRYSALRQITQDNVAQLAPAWTY